MKTYEGLLSYHFETGSEGIMWILETEDKSLELFGDIFIRKDDHLKVFNEKNEVVFDGKILLDTKTGWKEYPLNPGHGQQCALGLWVHWIQQGWQPDDWARLFVKKKGEPQLRAELTTDRKI